MEIRINNKLVVKLINIITTVSRLTIFHVPHNIILLPFVR